MADIMNNVNLMVMQKTLDGLWARQQAIADNIANVDTPGYKSKNVSFEDVLSTVLNTASDQNSLLNNLQSVQPIVTENTGTSMRADGNNVDIEAENIELARTQIQYEYMARQISDELSRLKYAINGGN